jgi:hypothetical protein
MTTLSISAFVDLFNCIIQPLVCISKIHYLFASISPLIAHLIITNPLTINIATAMPFESLIKNPIAQAIKYKNIILLSVDVHYLHYASTPFASLQHFV